MSGMPRRPGSDALRFSIRVIAFASVALLGTRLVTAHGGSATPPRGGSCSEACDRKAADCLEGCDGRFKEDKPRVECKIQCATDRQKCDAACTPP